MELEGSMKKQWIHRAQKEWDSNDGHDTMEKNRIATILRNNSIRHYPLFDQTIFINKQTHSWVKEQPKGYTSKEDLWRHWEVFKPDLLFPNKNLIIEIDGNFHFNTKKGIKQTNKRNEYYEYAGIRLIWYYADTLKEMSDAELFLSLVDQL
jgi:hypothetical protein